MGVIIDLDLTLVNSQSAEILRKARQWPKVYELISQFISYNGVNELLIDLSQRKIPVCVVTSSPRPYRLRVLDHFKWSGIETVCYHDTRRHKPDPEPILLALKKLSLTAEQTISVGDDVKDTVAAKAAGVFSVGALWGTLDRDALVKSDPDALCETVDDLRDLIYLDFEVNDGAAYAEFATRCDLLEAAIAFSPNLHTPAGHARTHSTFRSKDCEQNPGSMARPPDSQSR